MTNSFKRNSGVMALAVILALPFSAAAQSQSSNLRVSFTTAATAGALSGKTAWGGAVTYTFTPRFAFDVQVLGTDAPTFGGERGGPIQTANLFAVADPRQVGARGGTVGGAGAFGNVGAVNVRDGGPPQPLPQQVGQHFGPTSMSVDTSGSTILSTAGFRYLIPSGAARFQPYLSGGFGVSRADRSDNSRFGTVESGGVGTSVRVWNELWLDLDARYYWLNNGGRNLGTFGGGVSYRF